MGIEFKSGFKPKAFSKEALGRSAKALEKALLDARTQIVRRTQKGTDFEGKEFEPYSEGYAKKKIKAGRNIKPDLTFTGKMLASIQVNVDTAVSGLLGRIFFGSATEGAKAKYNFERRRFFELSKDQVKTIVRKVKEAFND